MYNISKMYVKSKCPSISENDDLSVYEEAMA